MKSRSWIKLFVVGMTLLAAVLWSEDYKFRHPYSSLFFSAGRLPPTPVPSPSPTPVRMYKALDVGKHGLPALSGEDQARIDAAVRHGVARRANVWWAYAGNEIGSGFVMIDAGGPSANPNAIHQREHVLYKVVLDPKPKCNNIVYSPIDNWIHATFSCQ
jgi:hypothetical protein